MKPTIILSILLCTTATWATPPPPGDSPFATPLTAEEAATGTGIETSTPPDCWLPPECGVHLGMGKFRARLARPGLRRDGESSRYCLVQHLSEKDGRGDIGLGFDDGKLALYSHTWSSDNGGSLLEISSPLRERFRALPAEVPFLAQHAGLARSSARHRQGHPVLHVP